MVNACADLNDMRKVRPTTEACCCEPCPERTLYDLLEEALILQQATQEHLSCAFAMLGLEPYNRENGRRSDTVIDKASELVREMNVLNRMAIALKDMVGTPKPKIC